MPSSSELDLSALASNATVDFQNPINLNGQSGATVRVYAGSAAVDAILSGSISNGGLIKQGSGTLELTGANNYTGATQVRGGLLLLGSAGALGSGNLSLANGSVLMLGTGDFTRALGGGAGQLSLSSGGFAAYGADRTVNLGGNATPTSVLWGQGQFLVQSNGGVPLVLSAPNANATVIFANPINLGQAGTGQRTIQVNRGSAAVDARLTGVISATDPLLGLTKTGDGILALDAANTYAGPTSVNGGVLKLEAGGSINNSPAITLSTGAALDLSAKGAGGYALAPGQALGGSGSVTLSSASGVLAVNGALDPAAVANGLQTSDIGTLLVNGSLGLGSANVVNMDVPGYAAGQFDQILAGLTGSTVTFGGTLDLNLAGITTPGSAQIFGFDGYSGQFGSIVPTGLGSGLVASFNATNGTLTINAIPEPATMAVLLMGLAGAAGRPRRRMPRHNRNHA